jgi:uncharacterized protein (TIGR03086 family)
MTSISERYAAAARRFTVLVDSVPADSWANPSPCDGWTAHDVLDHVVSTELDFLDQRDLPRPDVSALERPAAWPIVRAAMQGVLDDPATATRAYDGYFGPTTVGDTIDRFYSLDLLVHRWDLATAAQLADHAWFDPDEIEILRANTSNIPPEMMRTPGLFGPEIEPAADADDTTRMMNFLGRTA